MACVRPRNFRSIQDKPAESVFTQGVILIDQPMVQPDSAAVLMAVARLVGEAPNLSEAVVRLAPALRDAIPFERLHVLRLDRAELFVLYDIDTSGTFTVAEHRIAATSDPPPGPDVEGSLSRLVCTVRQGPRRSRRLRPRGPAISG